MSTIRVVNLQHTDATEPNIVLESDGTAVFASGITISGGTNLTVSGTAEFASGTVSAPGITFIDDNNTGIYSPGSDQLAISTNSTGRLFIDNSGRVGIGTSSPDQLLDIAANTDATVQLKSTKTGVGVNDVLGTIAYYGSDGSGSGAGIKSSITSTAQGTGGAGSDLRFHTTNSAGSNNTEKVRIDEQGRVGIGTASPSDTLHLSKDGSNYIKIQRTTSGSEASLVIGNDSTTNVVYSRADGVNTKDFRLMIGSTETVRVSNIGTCTLSTPTANYPASPAVEYYSPPGKYMLRLGVTTNVNNWVDFIGNYQNAIGTGTYIRFRPTFQNTSGQAGMYFGGISTTIQNTDLVGGKVTSGSTTSTAASITELFRFRNQGGLTFNGDTGDANALDDYEEGTFTPTLYGSTSNGTFTPTSQNGGMYTKIGNIVHCQINVQGDLTGAAGQPRVSGLPFTSAAGGSGATGNSTYSTGSLQYWNNSGADMMGPLNQASSTYIYFHTYDGDSSGTATVNNSNGHNLHCCVTYRVA